jgi:hypothetical protein
LRKPLVDSKGLTNDLLQSAASEFRMVPSVLCAAPTDADR